MVTVAIADKDDSVRSALSLAVDQLGYENGGEARDLSALLALLENRQQDVLLLDWTLCCASGNHCLLQVKKKYPHLFIIITCTRPESRSRVCPDGADAVIYKTDPPEVVLAVLRRISGQVTVGRLPHHDR
nr:response regulator transcription factor [Anaerolineae bacterium]